MISIVRACEPLVLKKANRDNLKMPYSRSLQMRILPRAIYSNIFLRIFASDKNGTQLIEND